MVRSYFAEVQHLRNNGWVWGLIIFVSAAILLPMAYGLYWQLVKGIPWGDEPLSDNGLIGLSVFVLFSEGLAAFVVMSLRLDLKIDEQGIQYRFLPLKRNWRLVGKSEIKEYSLKKGFPLFQSGGLGYHRNIFTHTRSFRITGSHYLRLELNNGEKLLFGTQNAGELEWAMKKLLRVNEPI